MFYTFIKVIYGPLWWRYYEFPSALAFSIILPITYRIRFVFLESIHRAGSSFDRIIVIKCDASVPEWINAIAFIFVSFLDMAIRLSQILINHGVEVEQVEDFLALALLHFVILGSVSWLYY